ncbi:hypothetical protein [Thalassospira marina]|nr:hypothetical protein [Thalassospira marina]
MEDGWASKRIAGMRKFTKQTSQIFGFSRFGSATVLKINYGMFFSPGVHGGLFLQGRPNANAFLTMTITVPVAGIWCHACPIIRRHNGA